MKLTSKTLVRLINEEMEQNPLMAQLEKNIEAFAASDKAYVDAIKAGVAKGKENNSADEINKVMDYFKEYKSKLQKIMDAHDEEYGKSGFNWKNSISQYAKMDVIAKQSLKLLELGQKEKEIQG